MKADSFNSIGYWTKETSFVITF